VSDEQRAKPSTAGSLIAQSSLLSPSLTLALFVFGINADHPHHTLAVDDLAFITNLLY
jgi:hypothetical protein